MILTASKIIIFALICLKCDAYRIPENHPQQINTRAANARFAKLETLQIEGTDRNLDETGDNRNLLKNSNNDYWRNLNWGIPPNRKQWRSRNIYDQPNSNGESKWDKMNYYDDIEESEPIRAYGPNGPEMFNPDAEFIDPSKVSGQLANLKLMRITKIDKDI